MINPILFLIHLLVADTTNQPVRLQKKEPETLFLMRLNDWVKRNYFPIMFALILFAILIISFSLIIGMGSTMDSGNYYYHLNEVI